MIYFKRSLSIHPIHVFLLPIFFIENIYIEYAGLIDLRDAAIAFFKIAGSIGLVFLLLYLIIKNILKAATITTILSGSYLFFNNIKNVFLHIGFLSAFSHYRFYLIVFSVTVLAALIFAIKREQHVRTNLFLNLLFLIFLLVDGAKLYLMDVKEEILTGVSRETEAKIRMPAGAPNIYYILLDCYPSSQYQKEMLGVNNQGFDGGLEKRGFYLVKNSKSNYNRTAFSMAATLNMDYIHWLDSSKAILSIDYNKALSEINHSRFVRLLKANGYHLYNLSIFDLDNHPAFQKENFLHLSGSQIIFFNTLWATINRELLWKLNKRLRFSPTRGEQIRELQQIYEPKKIYNKEILDSLNCFANMKKEKNPFFLYAHLYLPHFPYFYDSTGKEYEPGSLYTDSLITDRKKLEGYIVYTNKTILSLIDKLLQTGAKKDIIIIQSDHGIMDLDISRQKDAFKNFLAIYYPDGDYHLLTDSISNINTFRIILNKYSSLALPLLDNRSFYLKN